MKQFFLLFFIYLTLSATAQFELPNGFSEGENNLLQKNENPSIFQAGSGIKTPPPFSGIRTAAEWEEIQALTITWTSYTSILREIVRNAVDETRVIIICSDSNTVKSYLTAGNVALNNVSYLIAPFNAIWIRDYGQNSVYADRTGNLFLVDWHYNRPTRPKDDTVPSRLANFLQLPLYETTVAPYDLIHTGGNFMSDGNGTAFSSELTDQENPTLTGAQIDTIMKKFMGIDRYIRFPVLPYDGIHHIDMHMKLIDEQTLLVGQYPNGVSDGPQIEANLQYILSNYNSIFGTPYKVIRIPMPPDKNGLYPIAGGAYTTYTNAVFVNKTVILPTYYPQYDTTAIRIWKEALPGYKIIGIDCDNTGANIISQSGAIHCITHSVATADPLLITHQPLGNTCDSSSGYLIEAKIEHSSGILNATVFWTTDTTQGFIQTASMNNVGNNTWTTTIPPQPLGTSIFYYIQSTANSGKTISRPIVAPIGSWKFSVNCFANAIEEASSLKIQEVYPNPASSLTCIPISSSTAQNIKISLINLLSQERETIYEGITPSGLKNYFLFAENYPQGLHCIEVKTKNETFLKKLLIIKK